MFRVPRPHLWAALLFTLGSAGAQQSRVVPEFFTAREGNDSSLRPFAASAFRVQMIVSGGELANKVALLTDFAFRRDGTNASSTYAGRNVNQLTVTVGTSARAPATMAAAFATNRAGAQTRVFQGSYSLPAQPPVKQTGPFNVVFKIARPFVYVRERGDLLIELVVPGRNATKVQYPLDAISAGRGTQTVRPFGTKGPLKNNPSYRVTNNAPTRLQPGGAAVLDATDFTGALPALAVFGFSNRSFGPLKLPFDLRALGAAGNHLYVSMDVLLPLLLAKDANAATFSGRAETPIPAVVQALGLPLYGQALVIDQGSNALGLVLSNGVEMVVTRTPISPLQLLYADDSSAATGFFPLTANGGLGGLVTRFGGRFQ